MRVIGGYLKGRKLFFPKKRTIRPTKDIVREAIFDTLQDWISGKKVLELFSGTGALSIEALSRGAAEAVFIESCREAVGILRKNVLQLALENKTRVFFGEASLVLRKLAGERFHLVIADPPYKFREDRFIKILNILKEYSLLEENAILVWECPSEKKVVCEIEGWEIYKIRKYGNTSVFYLSAC